MLLPNCKAFLGLSVFHGWTKQTVSLKLKHVHACKILLNTLIAYLGDRIGNLNPKAGL